MRCSSGTVFAMRWCQAVRADGQRCSCWAGGRYADAEATLGSASVVGTDGTTFAPPSFPSASPHMSSGPSVLSETRERQRGACASLASDIDNVLKTSSTSFDDIAAKHG